MHIAKLWCRFAEIYGNLWFSKNGLEDSGIWLETLRDLTPIGLENGIKKLINLSTHKFNEFPPNCLQFKALCLCYYEELSLPSATNAFNEITNFGRFADHRYSHEVVRYIASKLPHDFLDKSYTNAAYKIFKDNYTQVCDLVKQGIKLPPITKKVFFLTNVVSRDVAIESLAKIKEILNGKNKEDHHDN